MSSIERGIAVSATLTALRLRFCSYSGFIVTNSNALKQYSNYLMWNVVGYVFSILNAIAKTPNAKRRMLEV